MSHELINRSKDLKKLQDEGYDMEIHENFLIIKCIPYVGDNSQVKHGTIASGLKILDGVTAQPDTHVALWIGDHPCNHRGEQLTSLVNAHEQTTIRDGLVSSHSFSQKPPNGYNDYHHKMTTYIRILQSHACVLNSSVTARINQSRTPIIEESVFHYTNTASARVGIIPINDKLKKSRVAVVGLGGTGSYVLDLVAKTPVEEIHLFDNDEFSQHNAFRSPGAPSSDDLSESITKVEWFSKIYSQMRKKIISHSQHIDESNISELNSMTAVFLCVDNAESRWLIVDHLIKNKISFIDVGIGLYNKNNGLGGSVRVTTCTPSFHNHATDKIPCGNDENAEYSNNIQIADMNALNAALAVIKWKKMCGFYHDFEYEHNATYQINTNRITNEDIANEAKDN